MLLVRSVVILLLGSCSCFGQDVEDYSGNDQSVVSARKNQDVAILKQIHRHNEDGSYTYGFEGADGSFKIETKTRSGEVTGKYGYVDDAGKLRVVEYGANTHGFQPAGDGITVPPPTLVQLRPDEDEGDDAAAAAAATPDERRPPRPQPKWSPPAARSQQPNRQPPSRDDYYAYARQPQRPAPAVVDSDGDDPPAGWAVRSDAGGETPSWSRQSRKPAAAVVPQALPAAPLYRPAEAARPSPPRPAVGGSFAAAPEAPSGSFAAAPEAPSGSYQSSQDFGRRPSAAVPRDPSSGRRSAYQTFEDQEPATESPLYLAAGRSDGAPARTAAARPAAAARQARPGGSGGSVLDQLARQYALPESGSPVSHSVSFGLDQ